MVSGSSPHTRGALVVFSLDPHFRRIIPAYAGSTSTAGMTACRCSDHPRIRGEHSSNGRISSKSTRIIPAYAGSTDLRWRRLAGCRDHPRIRGEHWPPPPPVPGPPGSSPHTRGAPRRSLRRPGRRGIIPAYAGSTTAKCPGRTRTADHPRIRGEHSNLSYGGMKLVGSSPHTRGARTCKPGRGGAGRIIPAYAGSTPSTSGQIGGDADHPRIRGEHFQTFMADIAERGSSPHTRGAPILHTPLSKTWRIIPAYAGSTTMAALVVAAVMDHPRIRGEHVDPITIGIGQWGSSPHTRGARPDGRRRARTPRIIPAYAGSTRVAREGRRAVRDHPRIRGEHYREIGFETIDIGSSPHTRGARRRAPGPRGMSRIIPAYAGSTLGNPCNTKDRRRDYTSFPLPVTHPSGGGGS